MSGEKVSTTFCKTPKAVSGETLDPTQSVVRNAKFNLFLIYFSDVSWCNFWYSGVVYCINESLHVIIEDVLQRRINDLCFIHWSLTDFVI